MKNSKKKTEPQQEWKQKPKVKKTEIPKKVLDKFLKDKIVLPEGTTVKEIRCNPLWSNRHRVNVWVERHKEGCYFPKMWIEYSYFLHFKDGKIIDKTIQPSPNKQKVF